MNPISRASGPIPRPASLLAALGAAACVTLGGCSNSPSADAPGTGRVATLRATPAGESSGSPPAASTTSTSALSASTSAAPPAKPPQEQTPAMGKPFMFREAKMPPGFPEPGPVGTVVVKHYPGYRLARVSEATRPGGTQDSMFMTLFRHIKSNKIAMTAPVEMEYAQPEKAGDSAAEDRSGGRKVRSMAFLYGDQSLGKPGLDGQVEVLDVEPVTVVSVAVRGDYAPKTYDKAIDEILAFLTANKEQYRQAGPPRVLGYNSPFVPGFLRMGEVQIPVEELR